MKKIFAFLMVVILLLSALPVVSAETVEAYPELELGKVTEVVISDENNDVYYAFTPTQTGFYRFYSMGDSDPFAVLYTDKWIAKMGGDDTRTDYNFSFGVKLTEGRTYYLEVSSWIEEDMETAEFQICVEETVGVVGAEIIQMPYNCDVVKGLEKETLDLSGFEVEFTISDGTKVVWNYNEDNLVRDYEIDTSWYYDSRDRFVLKTECSVYAIFTTLNALEGFEPELGDVDCDKEVSVMDATRIQRYIASMGDFTKKQKALSDVDGDDDVTVMDATLIQRMVAGFSE